MPVASAMRRGDVWFVFERPSLRPCRHVRDSLARSMSRLAVLPERGRSRGGALRECDAPASCVLAMSPPFACLFSARRARVAARTPWRCLVWPSDEPPQAVCGVGRSGRALALRPALRLCLCAVRWLSSLCPRQSAHRFGDALRRQCPNMALLATARRPLVVSAMSCARRRHSLDVQEACYRHIAPTIPEGTLLLR